MFGLETYTDCTQWLIKKLEEKERGHKVGRIYWRENERVELIKLHW